MNLKSSEEFSQRLVQELEKARLASGISKNALATMTGISRTMIYHLEKGDRNPTIITAHALATALGLDFAEIARRATRPTRQ